MLCIVGREFRLAIEHINTSIPQAHKIRYIALDFSRMSKNKGGAGGKDAKGAATGKEWSRIETSLGKEMEQNMRRAESGSVAAATRSDNRDDNEPVQGLRHESTGRRQALGDEAIVGRVDVLRELEDISSWTLTETALFSRWLSVQVKHTMRLCNLFVCVESALSDTLMVWICSRTATRNLRGREASSSREEFCAPTASIVWIELT